jgi:hypothetical protein
MCIPTNVATAAYPSLPNEGMPNAAPTSAVSVFCRAVTNVTLEEKSLSLKPIAMNKAQEFVKQHHRHNHEVKFGPRFAISVVDAAGEVLGVAICSHPVTRALNGNGYVLEVRRVCTREGAPMGCCSMLYNACKRTWKEMGGRKLITYTLQSEDGTSLRGAGWKRVAASKGHKVGQSWDTHRRKAKVEGTVTVEPKWRWEISC